MIHTVTKTTVKKLLPGFSSNIHKGDRGKVLVIGGSLGMLGAAIFSARASLNSGCGLTYLAVPYRYRPLININNPELITLPIFWSFKKIFKENKFDAVIMGPGLRYNFFNKQRLKDLLLYLSYYQPGQKVLLDAGAIMVLRKITRPLDLDLVITPHLKEMSRLIQIPLKRIQSRPWQIAEKVSQKYQTTVVLKSHQTRITRGKLKYINKTGTQALARGGSGDVLSGMIGSLMAQGLSGFQAAIAGNYLHGLSGQVAARNKSIDTVLPADIITAIPDSLKFVKGK